MKVIVASTNPVKINATEKAFSLIFPDETFEFEGYPIPSHVSDQPMSDQETFDGAMNRADGSSKEFPDADYWVGIEGGIEERRGEIEIFAWIVVKDKDGLHGKGRSSTMFMPHIVAEKVLSGMELGDAVDSVFNGKDLKKSLGLIGKLTHGLIDRTQYYVEPTIIALSVFKNKDLYL